MFLHFCEMLFLESICRDGPGKKWLPHVLCTNSYVQNSALDVVTSLYEPYQSFSSATRSLTLLETIAGVPHRQVAKRPNRLSSSFFLSFFLSFSQASTIMAEAITMTQTRKSGIFTGVLHSYHSVFKEIELVQQCSRALSSGRLPFHAILGLCDYACADCLPPRVC